MATKAELEKEVSDLKLKVSSLNTELDLVQRELAVVRDFRSEEENNNNSSVDDYVVLCGIKYDIIFKGTMMQASDSWRRRYLRDMQTTIVIERDGD